ncbi:MAG: serine/threonine protein kinase, partial [Ruminococcaceae bacterium]|nr:serine/threonine protein kinase [Oscillospiraceae bacterium]
MSNADISHIWPEWQIEKQIGKGAFGCVYRAVKQVQSITSYAAIKIISIPQDQSELETLRSEGISDEQSRTYFQGVVNNFVSEIQVMEEFKGTPNIVSVEDYQVIPKSEGIGWDIFIRMELLTPFIKYTEGKVMTEAEVIKLGIDMCSALELCSRRGIIHRDIKPENIFINDFGYYKLGDFGIARRMENMTGGLSQKGTYNYMAPEIFHGEQYDHRVDIYSLGIVLYRLLNQKRYPFLDAQSQLDPEARKVALERRMKGEALPPPSDASPFMANIVLKACAFDPNQRYMDATEMKKALEQLSYKNARVAVPTPSVSEPIPMGGSRTNQSITGGMYIPPSQQGEPSVTNRTNNPPSV